MFNPNLNTFSPPCLTKRDCDNVLPNFPKGSTIAVIGAGAFGSWAALYLLRKGFRVTLLEAWAPGHSRSSSGDETRVIRSTYGANETYFDLNVQAIGLWKENQHLFNKHLFFNTGVLWLCYEARSPLVDDSIPFATKHSMEYEYLERSELKKRFPEINVMDLHHGYLDPFGGYLKARESIQAVATAFLKEGGHYKQSHVKPGKISKYKLEDVSPSDGSKLHADAYIFACGSWLAKLFPDALGNIISCTKQETYYFGVPSENSLHFENMPVWIDVDGENFYYGIPGGLPGGFKIGVDIRGEIFDPTSDDQTHTPATLKKARAFIEHRFPNLKNAPLVHSRVCPYENSLDGNFIFDLLPETTNAFILGGGSGHGFKHGPALGYLVAQVLAGETHRPELFSLASKIFRK